MRLLRGRHRLGLYLRRSWHHGRWLFDDVDVAGMRRYLGQRRSEIERQIGAKALGEVLLEIEELDLLQQQWKSIPLHCRSLQHELLRGGITRAQAEHYSARPLRWLVRLAGRRAAASLTGSRRSRPYGIPRWTSPRRRP